MLAHRSERSKGRGLLLGLAALMTAAALAFGSAAPAGAIDAAQVRISTAGATHALAIDLNKSVIVDLPIDVREVIVSQPGIAQTIMRTKRRAIIQGVAAGSTNIFFLDATGAAISVLDIEVAQEPSPVAAALETTLSRVLRGSNIHVEVLSDGAIDGTTHFVLTGTVQTAQDKAIAEQLASDLSEGDEDVGSLIQVIGPKQVMLKVTVAEVRRDAIKQFGINLSATVNGGLSTGILSGPMPSTPLASATNPNPNVFGTGAVSGAVSANSVSLSANLGAVTIEALLRALERRNAVRTLAEPVLVALSGQPAEFFAGGQFPFQTVADGNVSTEFKDVGVRLAFTPVIQSNGSIGLTVQTEVSEPGPGNSISQRRATTTVELPPGCTLAIAGMFQDSMRQQVDKWPWLGDIPILGALFRNRDFIRQQTELVILVTPQFAETGNPGLPTEQYAIPSDAETIFLGRMERNYSVGDGDNFRGGFDGAVGFVLD